MFHTRLCNAGVRVMHRSYLFQPVILHRVKKAEYARTPTGSVAMQDMQTTLARVMCVLGEKIALIVSTNFIVCRITVV